MEKRKPVKVTDQNFEEIVLKSSGIVVVDFWAIWCIPCLIMGRTLSKVTAHFAGKMTIGKLNVDLNRTISAQFGIRAIPCLIVFRDGKEVGRILGAMGAQALTEQLTPYLPTLTDESL